MDQYIVKTCLNFVPRLLVAFAIVFGLIAMVQGQHHQQHQPQFVPLPTGPMPAALIP